MKVLYILFLSGFYFFSQAMERTDQQVVVHKHHHHHQDAAVAAMTHDSKRESEMYQIDVSDDRMNEVELGQAGHHDKKQARLSIIIPSQKTDKDYEDMAQTSFTVFFKTEDHGMQFILERVQQKMKAIDSDPHSPHEHKIELANLHAAVATQRRSVRSGARASEIADQITASKRNVPQPLIPQAQQPVLQTQQPPASATNAVAQPATTGSPQPASLGSEVMALVEQGIPLASQIILQAIKEHNASQTQTITTQTQTISTDQKIKVVSWAGGVIGVVISGVITWLTTHQTSKC